MGLTNRKNGYSNRKIVYECLLVAMSGNLIILKNVKPLLPHGGYDTRSGRGEIYEV